MKPHNTTLKIYTDGGARGNPGPAAIGIAVYSMDDELIKTHSAYIGETTNNIAEYTAAFTALEIAQQMGVKTIHMYLDSELVVKQLNREYKIKNEDLGKIFIKIHNISQQFDAITYTHIPRAENKKADALVNEALDAR